MWLVIFGLFPLPIWELEFGTHWVFAGLESEPFSVLTPDTHERIPAWVAVMPFRILHRLGLVEGLYRNNFTFLYEPLATRLRAAGFGNNPGGHSSSSPENERD